MMLSSLATRAVAPRNLPSTRPCVAPAAALRLRLHPTRTFVTRAAAVDAPAPAAEDAASEAPVQVHDDGSTPVVRGPTGRSRYQLRTLTTKIKDAVAKHGRSSFTLRMPAAKVVPQQYNNLFRSIAYANKSSLNIMKEVTTAQPRTVPDDGSAELVLGRAPGSVVNQLRAGGTKDPKQLAADQAAAAAYAADPANAPKSPPVHLKLESPVKVTAGWSGAATLESIVKPLLLTGQAVAVDLMDDSLPALLGQLTTIRKALVEHRELGDIALVVDTEMIFPDMKPEHAAAAVPEPAAGTEEEGKDNGKGKGKVLPDHRFVLYVLRCEVDSPQSLVTSPVPAEHVESFLAAAAKAFA